MGKVRKRRMKKAGKGKSREILRVGNSESREVVNEKRREVLRLEK